MFAGKTYNQTVGGDEVLDFLEFDLLPLMSPFPQPRSVLILDNASPHSKVRIEQLCTIKGVIVLWLPPYSYDKNPIELAFHNTKSLLKRRYGLNDIEVNVVNPQRLLECLLDSVTPDDACNFFRRCHIEVSPEVREWANRN